jgi:hypothetical protein
MAQQVSIMKPGVSYAITCTPAATTVAQALSPAARFIRVCAGANPARLALGQALVNINAVGSGVYLPGTTFGPDIYDVTGYTTVSVASDVNNTIVYITELSP